MNKLANRKKEKKRRSNKSDWKKRWKGGIYSVVGAVEQKGGGWGEIFETETHIRLLSTCVCVCEREREREI
jgi:hypothetical protein